MSQAFSYSPSWLGSDQAFIKYFGQYFKYVPLPAPDQRVCPSQGDQSLVQAVGNLVENALKHTPAGTRVTVRTNGSSLAVYDDGPGIPPEHVDNVFDRFYRVDGAHASGSGLGLAIAKELAEAMGGTLEAESKPGDTAFTLRLPAVASTEKPGRFHGKTERRADIETGVI